MGQPGFAQRLNQVALDIAYRQLDIGQEDRGMVLVTKGLKAGEKVVVDGQLRLQPGATVQLVDRNGNPIQTGALEPADGATIR